MRLAFIIFTSLHGLIHLLGFIKSVNGAAVAQLNLPISRMAGLLWLLAALLFLAMAALMLLQCKSWWIVGAAAILLSQALVIRYWSDARAGTIANLVILVPVIITALGALPSSFGSQYRKDVYERLKGPIQADLLTEKDMEHLPETVQRYLRYTRVTGKPKVYNFRASFSGSMRQKPESGWMRIRSEQYNFFDYPARLFYIRASMYGVPFDGYHHFTGGHAVMQIRVANLVDVVDARGAKMDQGETVTMFNDMCLLAPATLIDPSIRWQELKPGMVEAEFANGTQTIKATLLFNEEGALINFISKDRFLCNDGKTYLSYPWSTPVGRYFEYDGRMIPAYGEAIWHLPEGPFSYARFEIAAVDYNISSGK